MARVITIELSDEEYGALHQAAQLAGEAPATLLRRLLRRVTGLTDTDATARAALHADVLAAVHEAAAAIAQTTGITPEAAIADWRASLPPLRRRTVPAEPGPFCGVIRSGDRMAGDNDRIDRDLAAEYAGGADKID